jgi:oligopeptide transport system substrate-binding protein
VPTGLRLAALATALAVLGGCGRGGGGPVAVEVIAGADAREPRRVLDDAVAQGLVRFDAAGQIEPGLAERWIVIDDGLSYIFRLRPATWPDGSAVRAPEVAAAFRRRLADRRNPLRPFLSAIDEVVAMTPEVLEVHLSRPRPDLLKLFAQPEMALARGRDGAGSGPFRLMRRDGEATLLRPVPDPNRDPEEEAAPRAADDVRLRGPRAALAVARFAAGHADLVAGGTLADWPIALAAAPRRATLRTDPAAGLLGLAIVRRDGFLAEVANRTAVAEAIDRGALAAAFGAGWTPAEQIVPEPLDSAEPPAVPGWTQLTLDGRRGDAAARVAVWRINHPEPLRLRLALPAGPGGTLLWGQLAADLARIGILAERVAADAGDADLRLVDAVAPYDSARWYLAAACRPCGTEAAARLEAARLAPSTAARAQAIAAADLAVAADVPFVVLARPFRWSLVDPRLRQWTPNARAWHPLNRLAEPPR